MGSGVLSKVIELLEQLLLFSPTLFEGLPQAVQSELSVNNLILIERVIWSWALNIDFIGWKGILLMVIDDLRRLVLLRKNAIIRSFSLLSLGWRWIILGLRLSGDRNVHGDFFGNRLTLLGLSFLREFLLLFLDLLVQPLAIVSKLGLEMVEKLLKEGLCLEIFLAFDLFPLGIVFSQKLN